MRGCNKMAELKFQAPLATVESEEWNDFNDFQTAVNSETTVNDIPGDGSTEKVDTSESDNFGVCDTYSGSLQDLVHSLDEKITNCFCNYEDKVEQFAPVQIRSQEEIMSDCQTWWTITGNFGNILPIDWSKSYARQLQTKALNLGERKEPESQNLDLSDDEELAQAMDFHSMLLTSHHTDPDHVVTADEVISELESMMEDPNTDRSDLIEPQYPDMTISPYTKVKDALHLPSYTPEELKALSHTALNEVLNDFELIIKELSETLVQELALRDELEYDKELKNQFISLLLTIQKKRRESNVDKKKRRSKSHVNNSIPMTNSSTSPSAEAAASIFLTTVIPYHPNQGPPTSEQLQIYIKILQAINEDSPTVPSLLTDYILKVLCPT